MPRHYQIDIFAARGGKGTYEFSFQTQAEDIREATEIGSLRVSEVSSAGNYDTVCITNIKKTKKIK